MLAALSGKYRVYLLTNLANNFESSYHSKLKRVAAGQISVRSLETLLKKHRFRLIIIKNYSLLRGSLRTVRSVSPSTPLAVYDDDASLLFNGKMHGFLRGYTDEKRTGTLMSYANADFVITEKESDSRALLRAGMKTGVTALRWKKGPAPDQNRLFSILEKPGVPARRLSRKPASVLILCHNQLRHTRKCIESVLKYTDIPYELILIDNNSSDGTRKYLESVPGATVIFNRKNLGYVLGNNAAIRQAKGDHVVILNNDTVVTEGWLRTMITCAQAGRNIGIVGPRTNTANIGAQNIDEVPYKTLGQMHKWAHLFGLRNRADWFETLWLTGFCLVIKKEVIDRVGVFDELFAPGCYEDFDYCLRARKAGYKIVCCGDVFVHHNKHKSYGENTFLRLNRENQLKFVKKWGLPALKLMYDNLS